MRLSAERIAGIRYGWFSDHVFYDRIERVVPARWADDVMDWVDRHIEQPFVARVLPRFCAHEAVPDHCGRPEHDLCRGCDKRMPGMAPRGGAR